MLFSITVIDPLQERHNKIVVALTDRTTHDYINGRLLSVAVYLEQALKVVGGCGVYKTLASPSTEL